MEIHGRSAELGRLRHALDQNEASIVRVTGMRGVGKSTLVARPLADYRHLVLRARPFPDPAQRAHLRAVLDGGLAAAGIPPSEPTPEDAPEWRALFDRVLALAGTADRPFVLVLDDIHRLVEARSRYRGPLTRLIEKARARTCPLHVVLVGPRSAMPTEEENERLTTEWIELRPLPFRAALPLLPGSRPHDLVRAYGVFGGIPRVLSAVDRDAALGTNVRRLLLAEGGTLTDAGGAWLERDVQTPSRYYSIMATLACGEAHWSALHAGVPDLTRSGQVAPYVKRLEELGLVEARRSLDAAPAARARRYALTDPFLATWSRFALLVEPSTPGSTDTYSSVVRPALDDHLASVFPSICRQHMEQAAGETLGSSARENGSLWGAGYDIPVAGILKSGFAYYGACLWQPSKAAEPPLELLDRQLRETRYGFGREHRLRVVFTGQTAPRWLSREVARRHDARLVDPEVLVGEALS